VTDKRRLPLLGQPDPERPSDVHLVGRYALGVTWGDSHGSIYPFEHLRRACACATCGGLETLTAAMAWPERIQRGTDGLEVTWSDGHASRYPYPALRQSCRCAGCTGGH
jgi:DUF971 family protein